MDNKDKLLKKQIGSIIDKLLIGTDNLCPSEEFIQKRNNAVLEIELYAIKYATQFLTEIRGRK